MDRKYTPPGRKLLAGLRAFSRLSERRYRRRQVVAAGVGVALTGLGFGIARLLGRGRHAGPQSEPPVAPALPIQGDPPGILFHHSDSPGVVGGVPMNAARLDAIHAEQHPDWAIKYKGHTYHIGYHFVVLPDGKIEKGRPEGCQGAHCPHYNDWLGICLIGAFSTLDNPSWHPSRPTDRQIQALLALCQELMSKYHIPPENVRRHRDVRETYCPGGRFPYDAIIAHLQTYAASHPETRPNTPRLVAPAPLPEHKSPRHR